VPAGPAVVPSDAWCGILGPVDPAATIRDARRRAGLTQRQLAERAGTSQAAVARYERGRTVPDLATFTRLVRACGLELRATPAPPAADPGIDRSTIRRLLALSVPERVALAVEEGRSIQRFDRAVRAARPA
jgi:transcriptional regulator with XRE-family HTH domain